MSKIIFLNGCGSSGKTSIAKAIQELSDTPWLLLGLDMFIDIIPEQYMAFGDKAEQGFFTFTSEQNHNGHAIRVEQSPKGNQFFSLLPPLAKAIDDQGNNLIIDEVLYGDEHLKHYMQALISHTVYFVGVFCDIETLRERELARGDRDIGLANDQIDQVHSGVREYDLKVDTTHTPPIEAAKQILEFANTHNH